MCSSKKVEDRVVRTGIARLDADGGVLRRGKVTVLAGVSGMGKSTMAINMVLASLDPPKAAAAYFTSFYENGDLLLRLFANASGVEPARSSLRGRGSAGFADMARRRGLHLFPGGGLVQQHETVARSTAQAIALSPGLAMVAVDPVLTSPSNAQYGQDERRRTLEGFREVAREQNVAVLLVTAVSRTLLDDDKMRPSLRHLHRKGVALDLVDTALLLHRPAFYTPEAPQQLAEVAVHDMADGSERLVSLRFLGMGHRFED